MKPYLAMIAVLLCLLMPWLSEVASAESTKVGNLTISIDDVRHEINVSGNDLSFSFLKDMEYQEIDNFHNSIVIDDAFYQYGDPFAVGMIIYNNSVNLNGFVVTITGRKLGRTSYVYLNSSREFRYTAVSPRSGKQITFCPDRG